MNILITGAFGFVGNNLSQSLKTFKHHLIAVDIQESASHCYNDFYSWIDLKNVNLSKVDVIIHLAGKAHDIKNTTEEKTYFDINVGLTQEIFEYFLQSDANKFIFFSSVKAIADSVDEVPITEDEIPDPKTSYGRSKLEAERYILSQPLSKGKKVYILRPCMIHGPGNKGNLNLLFKLVSKGIPWPLGAFENKRSYISIENLQFVIQQIIEKDIEPGTYHVADDETLSTNNLINQIAASQGKKAGIWKINSKLITFTARVGDNLHLPLNSERLKKLTETYIVSNQKLKIALGIDKMPLSALEGMRKTLDSFKK